MFEVGFTEILLILGLALLVLGPEKLPGLARKIGAWTGRARAMANQLRAQLEQEIVLDKSNSHDDGQADPSKPKQDATAPLAPASAGEAGQPGPDADVPADPGTGSPAATASRHSNASARTRHHE